QQRERRAPGQSDEGAAGPRRRSAAGARGAGRGRGRARAGRARQSGAVPDGARALREGDLLLTMKALALAVLWGVFCAGAGAQGNKLYKYTDEKGNVVYSQTPPMSGTKSQKLDAR